MNKTKNLANACLGGNLEVVNLVISADYWNWSWNWGLVHACYGGHAEMVNLMISRGADDWNWGLKMLAKEGTWRS